MATQHVSPYAGAWYPGRADELKKLLEELFERSRQRTGPCTLSPALAYLVPHAGLAYSGTVAAAAYRQLARQRPSRVILLGFSHRGGPSGVAIPDVDAIVTPLGEVAVDGEVRERLAGREPFQCVPEESVCDHSIEIQLPLLQKAAPGTPVVPLYVGRLDAVRRQAAAEALAELAGPGTVFLASSDLTHYGRSFHYEPFPAGEAARKLPELDESVVEAAGSLDADYFLDCLARQEATVCGYEPMALLLETLRRAGEDEVFQEKLDYQTSGEITGDYSQSVSYGALGYYRAGSLALGPADQNLLLESAHRTLDRLFRTGKREPVYPQAITPALARRRGVFVSLREGACLRGCVGNHTGQEPLGEAVAHLTLAAALDDGRFEPLRQASRSVEVEISVLTPMKRIGDAAAFQLGRHGAYLECGVARSLLLPQVGRDENWGAETFLSALSHKAGLPAEAWKTPAAHLYVFRAQVFARVSGTPRANQSKA